MVLDEISEYLSAIDEWLAAETGDHNLEFDSNEDQPREAVNSTQTNATGSGALNNWPTESEMVSASADVGGVTSISELTGETPAETQTYEQLIYAYGFENVPGILSDTPTGVYESMYGPLNVSAGSLDMSGIYDYYGDSWYGGQPIEYDYSNYYPEYFGFGADPDYSAVWDYYPEYGF